VQIKYNNGIKQIKMYIILGFYVMKINIWIATIINKNNNIKPFYKGLL